MIQKLKNLLLMSDDECRKHLIDVLSSSGYTVNADKEKNYVFAYPEDQKVVPVLLMAHWDTKRKSTGKLADEPVALLTEKGKIDNCNGILGADDRAGVSMILEAQDQFNTKPMLLFTNHEETGGRGMSSFLETDMLRPFLECINLSVSVDRRGHNQWVCYYNNDSPELEEFMLRLGYVEEVGSWTDGADLAEKYNLAHVNVSYGGYLPHTADEFILEDSYISGVERLVSLIERCDTKFERLHRPHTSYSPYSSYTTVVTPASNNGQGTAAYDHPPKNMRVMTGHETISIRLTEPMCEVCGASNTSVHFNTRGRHFLCGKCLNRIMNQYHKMTPETVRAGIKDLEQQQRISKEANVLLKPLEHMNSDFPTCPSCGKKTHVSWSRKKAGFICTECNYAHSVNPEKFKWNGVFWVKSTDKGLRKIYVLEDIVYEINEDNSKMLRSVSIHRHDMLHKCSVCGKISANRAENPKGKFFCKECEFVIGDLIDEWEDTRVIDVTGSETTMVPF